MRSPGICSSCGARLPADTGLTGICTACGLALALDRSENENPTVENVPSGRTAPRIIGPYRLLQRIGEGGMGEVWQAEQTEPLRRLVALKLIKPGLDSQQVIARFEVERQALALMDHPCVAKVLDAGTTDEGRPFFAMEYIAGDPITMHCDRHRLTTGDRIELFLQVCDGVQHAHQKAILHRDLKPSNVLVSIQDGVATPKIIDFGVAKAMAQRLTDRTMFTEVGILIGTPEYMSPEQADSTAQDVDTRTDVYSLGVLLYELLAGALPFESKELREAGVDGVRRMIRDVEPPRPSLRLSTLGDERSSAAAGHRQVNLATLRRQLAGELDWITMKALEKDRTRRYGTSAELAEDLRRHMRHEPVLAGPPSASYRARKFVRRHRAGVSIAAVAAVAVLGFGVTMGVQARRIAAERESSDRVSEFLANMLGSVKPQDLGNALWKDLRERVSAARRERNASNEQTDAALAAFDDAFVGVNPTDAALKLLNEQILDRAAQTIDRELAQQPRIAGRLEHVLGETYLRLGLHLPAERHAARAVEIRASQLGAEHPDTLLSKANLARAWSEQGRFDEAERLLLQTIEIQRRRVGPEHPDTLASMGRLAGAYRNQARFEEAEKLLSEVLEARRRVLGAEHQDTLWSIRELALLYYSQERYEESERLGREALDSCRKALGPEHPGTLAAMNLLGNVYQRLQRWAEAEQLHREGLEIKRRVFGQEHPDTLRSMNNLATVLWSQGRLEPAETTLRETIEIRRRVLRRDHPETLSSMHNLALVYMDQRRNDLSEQLFREAFVARERELAPGHPLTLDDMYMIGCLAALRGDKRESLHWLRRAVELGYKDAVNLKPMATEDKLESLRGDPEFEALAARARRSEELEK